MNTPAPQATKHRRSPLRRVLKWTGITLGTLIVLIIVAIVVIPHVVNTGPIKHEIERIAGRSTGREVAISGPLSLSLFPWVGFNANDVTMANPPGFGSQPFLQVKELEIHVKLIPLIFHHVEVSGITLDALALNLARKADGTSNWQDFGGSGTGSSGSGQQGRGLAGLSVGSVSVRDSMLDYDDAQAQKRYTLSHFSLSAGGIQPGKNFALTAQMNVASKRPHFDARLKLDTHAQFDAALNSVTLSEGSLTTDVSNAGLGNSPLTVSTSWKEIALNKVAGTAALSDLVLQLVGMKAQLNAQATGLDKTLAVRGHLDVAPFAPRQLFTALGDPIPTTLQGFKQASLSADLDANAKSARLTNMTLKLDETTLTGRMAVADFAKGALRFNLVADRLNLDNYLPPGSGPAAHAGTSHGSSFMDTRLPGELLKKLDVSGKLAIDQLSGFGLTARNVNLSVNAAKGAVRLNPVGAKLYGGTFGGKVIAAAAGQGVRLTTDEKLVKVDAGQLIQALYGSKRLSGTADASLQLAGQGDTVAELIDNLKGKTAFSLQHGAITGFNLWQSIEQAYALIKEHKRVSASGPDATDFTSIQGTASIANSVINNDALNAALPFLSVTGHGTVNLKTQQVDYDLLGKVVKQPPAASGLDLSQLAGITVPIHISGNLHDLTSAPDMKQALEASAKSALQKKLDEQKKSAQDKLKQQLQDLLGGGGGGGGGG